MYIWNKFKNLEIQILMVSRKIVGIISLLKTTLAFPTWAILMLHNIAFSEEQLTVILMDLFLAGAETTSTTLTWSLINLMQYPEKQKKIHDEIDNILGDEVPNLEYKGRCVAFLWCSINAVKLLYFISIYATPLSFTGCYIPKHLY